LLRSARCCYSFRLLQRPALNYPINDAGPSAQASQRLDDQREAIGEIIASTAAELHLYAVLVGDDSKPVVLNLVQRFAARRQLVGLGSKTRRDEPGAEGYAANGQ
jgi:hypothetical protein